MATKDYCLSAKTDIIYGEPLTDQYSNLNLNQNYQSLYADNEGSKIIVTNSRKGQNYDFTSSDDLKGKKDLWNKSSKKLSSHLLNFNQESKEQNELKKLKDLNNSTLSLHIAAYENSNEDSDGGETESFKSKNQKTTLNKKWKTSKQAFNSSSLFDQNLFELPRQQKDQSSNNPEVMQFKASQRLRNPNDENTAPSSFVQSNRPQNKAMNALKAYAAENSGSGSEEEEAPIEDVSKDPEEIAQKLGLTINPVSDVIPFASASQIAQCSQVAVFDPKTKELKSNPRYEELFKPEAGPLNPFKSNKQRAQKNTLAGFVEKAHINPFHFNNEIRSFDTLGFARDPSAEAGNAIVGNVAKAEKLGGASVAEPSVKTGLQKRKRTTNYDAADVEGFTGPWSKFVDEKTVAKADPELQKEMDDYMRKKRQNSRAGRKKANEEQHLIEESVTVHIKDNPEYKQRSFMEVPPFTGVNLRADYCPHRCFPPTKLMHTYKGHSKPINAVRWLPGSAHLFMSCSMDAKVKLWEVYGNRKCIQTYFGHKLPIKDICFNNDGREFITASFDNYIKIWDTETGQVKQRLTTGHKAFCVTYNPDDDKQNIFLSGMQNKKIVQWDTRTGETEQEYDRHLGSVNSITFFDENRRFCSTSDDKSLRIWEWGIPVDTKLIQNAGLHSIPTMTKSPNEKWIVGQAMDNRLVLFELIDDKLKFSKKHAFRGHNVAGYACTSDFSPEMSFICSGDAQGRVFIWDWTTHKIVTRWKAHDNVCIATLWHPHEKSRVLTAGWDGDIKMWNS